MLLNAGNPGGFPRSVFDVHDFFRIETQRFGFFQQLRHLRIVQLRLARQEP